MATTMNQVLADPRAVAKQIVEDPALPYVSSARVVKSSRRGVKINVRLEPWEAMGAAGYPRERIRLEIDASGRVRVYPISSAARKWEHRHPNGGPLCLFYPGDPEPIVWSPETGSLEELLGIISRHVQAEEFYRREGRWPWEDAPHGAEAADGPQTDLMKMLAGGAA
jgi:hypothetical protein